MKLGIVGLPNVGKSTLFNAITKVAEGEVEIEVDANERASISAGNARYKLVGMPESEFPKLPKDEEAYEYGKKVGEPKQTSGKQELYEAIVSLYCE